MVDGERLLTQAERDFILATIGQERFMNKRRILLLLLILILLTMLSALWGFLSWSAGKDILSAVLCGAFYFGVILILVSILLISQFVKLRTVVKEVKANTMYAQEARYERTTGKYHITFLKMYKNGRLQQVDRNLMLCEPLKRGDAVIVLKMKGQAWVYKARK